MLKLAYPIERGCITSWDDMEKIWKHAFCSELRISPEGRRVLLSEAPLTPPVVREKVAEFMFERFETQAAKVISSAELSLYAAGHTTGIILESGHGVTCAVPIFQGQTQHHATIRLELAGCDLNDHLTRLLAERGYVLDITEREVITQVKEKLARVALDFAQEMRSVPSREVTYELPDGQAMTIGDELFRCPEALFHTTLLGLRSGGIHELLHNSIAKCNSDLRPELFANVVFSGGNTMFPGLAERMHRELALLSPDATVKIVAVPERRFLAWLGGSILASLPTFQQVWITKKEYHEFGPSVIHRK